MVTWLTYVTHATTVDNERGLATGWLPGELSATGREQARALGERFPDGSVHVVYSSDLRRAVETVAIAFHGRRVPVIGDRRLRECDYGDWNGKPAATIAGERLCRIDEPFPGGQSYRDVVTATASFLADLARERDGQRVLVVAHSANRWALACLLGGSTMVREMSEPFTWRPGWHYEVPTGFDPPAWSALRG